MLSRYKIIKISNFLAKILFIYPWKFVKVLSKDYYLVFEVVILNLKMYFQFIAFFNACLIKNIGQIELSKWFGLS